MGKKILVIEDEQNIRENLIELLELSGYEMSGASNGIEGVKAAKSVQPDLILCDVMMPEMDGYGVLQTLSTDNEIAHTPFIFLTAKADIEDLRKGMRFGADDYLTKPYNTSELLAAIEVRIKKSERLKTKYSADYSGLTEMIQDMEPSMNMETVLANANVFKGKKKDSIFREGAYPKEIFYISKGKIKGTRMNEEGKELITQLWETGDFFGVISAMNETPYSHSAIASEDYELHAIPVPEFRKLMQSNVEIANRFMKILAGDIESKEKELLEIAYGTVRSRLAESLLKLAETYADNLEEGIKLTRGELAQFIGAAPETLMRTIKDFKDEGLITSNGTKIIPNVERLKNMKY